MTGGDLIKFISENDLFDSRVEIECKDKEGRFTTVGIFIVQKGITCTVEIQPERDLVLNGN